VRPTTSPRTSSTASCSPTASSSGTPPKGSTSAGFYGQPLTGRAAAVEGAVQLSLVEAASLAADGVLAVDVGGDGGRIPSEGAAETDGPVAAVVARGRDVEGERVRPPARRL